MKANVEYTSVKGRRVLVCASSQPLEFPNMRAAHQFVRNHRYQYQDAKPVERV